MSGAGAESGMVRVFSFSSPLALENSLLAGGKIAVPTRGNPAPTPLNPLPQNGKLGSPAASIRPPDAKFPASREFASDSSAFDGDNCCQQRAGLAMTARFRLQPV
jgi:hypothetical protein